MRSAPGRAISYRPAYGIQNTWYRRTGNECGPDDAIWGRQMIEQDSWAKHTSAYMIHCQCGLSSRMTIRRYHGDIECTTSTLICLLESERTSGEEHCLNVSRLRKKISWRTFSAHLIEENRAPVSYHRLIQTPKASSHAVILFANSGTRRCLSSSSVRVHSRAATIPPADVPVTTRGSRSASRNALTTPKLLIRTHHSIDRKDILVVAEGSST